VTDDWTQTLSTALSAGEQLIGRTIQKIALAPSHRDDDVLDALSVCRSVNETQCGRTMRLQAGEELLVAMYNPLPRQDSPYVEVLLGPQALGAQVRVTRVSGAQADTAVSVEVLPTAALPEQSALNKQKQAPYKAVFRADNLPALSTGVFLLQMEAAKAAVPTTKEVWSAAQGDLTISNGEITVRFDGSTGLMSQLTRGHDSIALTNELAYYRAWQQGRGAPTLQDGRDPHVQNLEPAEFLKGPRGVSSQPSGAYIFRTQESEEQPTSLQGSAPVKLEVVRGQAVTEVHQTFADWAVQVVRLRQDSPLVELEWTVGPVPIKDGLGKEVVSRYTSSVQSGDRYFTDSNSREFQPRRRVPASATSEFVAGNYYPLSTAAYIEDDDVSLSVLVDRGEGAASLASGQLEMLIHRRLLQDDWRGVGEALNETTGGMTYPDTTRHGVGITVRGTHHLLLSSKRSGPRDLRVAMDKVFLPGYALYGKPVPSGSAPKASRQAEQSLIGLELPENIALMTLAPWNDHEILVRLSHQFSKGESEELSQPVTVDLAALLSPLGRLSSVERRSLSANQGYLSMMKRKIQWNGAEPIPIQEAEQDEVLLQEKGLAVMRPMMVNTYIVTLK